MRAEAAAKSLHYAVNIAESPVPQCESSQLKREEVQRAVDPYLQNMTSQLADNVVYLAPYQPLAMKHGRLTASQLMTCCNSLEHGATVAIHSMAQYSVC